MKLTQIVLTFIAFFTIPTTFAAADPCEIGDTNGCVRYCSGRGFQAGVCNGE